MIISLRLMKIRLRLTRWRLCKSGPVAEAVAVPEALAATEAEPATQAVRCGVAPCIVEEGLCIAEARPCIAGARPFEQERR
jgi:hypothetical protein